MRAKRGNVEGKKMNSRHSKPCEFSVELLAFGVVGDFLAEILLVRHCY
jgi:hypothetical protein